MNVRPKGLKLYMNECKNKSVHEWRIRKLGNENEPDSNDFNQSLFGYRASSSRITRKHSFMTRYKGSNEGNSDKSEILFINSV